uniref:Ion_trans_2 domain-containing protein n=1 Tax=Heterorhabditis bacteriophora TaxID=37862 RepID=A0A1I7XPW0_HETBA
MFCVYLPFIVIHDITKMLMDHRISSEYSQLPESDPWDLDQLLEGEQIIVPAMPAWKKYARIILPHVGLILLSLLYVIGGAVAFYHMERPHEVAVRESSIKKFHLHKDRMLDELWTLIETGASPDFIGEVASEYVDNVTRILFEAFDTHYINANHLRPGGEKEAYSWTFITALFFTATLLTTIGYGNLVPVTWQGHILKLGKDVVEVFTHQYNCQKKPERESISYSCIISFMSQVGFGDIVPTNREFYLLDLCYIIVGLAITTMCIDLVGIQYIRKIHYFGRAIKDARFALVNVGGKMVHVPDLMRYASVLQQV